MFNLQTGHDRFIIISYTKAQRDSFVHILIMFKNISTHSIYELKWILHIDNKSIGTRMQLVPFFTPYKFLLLSYLTLTLAFPLRLYLLVLSCKLNVIKSDCTMLKKSYLLFSMYLFVNEAKQANNAITNIHFIITWYRSFRPRVKAIMGSFGP